MITEPPIWVPDGQGKIFFAGHCGEFSELHLTEDAGGPVEAQMGVAGTMDISVFLLNSGSRNRRSAGGW